MCRTLFLALTGAALLALTAAPASAGKPRKGRQPAKPGKKVWSGLVVATNAPKPLPAPAELNRLDGTLRRTFGYNQFEVIGQSRRALQNGEANWLAVSKHFSLHVDPEILCLLLSALDSCSPRRIGADPEHANGKN